VSGFAALVRLGVTAGNLGGDMGGHRSVMRRSAVFVAIVAVTALTAIPAVAEAPETEVSSFDEELSFEGPNCVTDEELFVLEATFTVRDIIFEEGDGGKVFTTMSTEITGPDPWSGQGTQTQLQHNGERTLSVQFVASNSDTGEKVQFHANIRFPENGEPDLEPPFGLRCIRP
jgi:hypothetical protein